MVDIGYRSAEFLACVENKEGMDMLLDVESRKQYTLTGSVRAVVRGTS